MTERFDRSATQFDPTVANPISAAAVANYARSPIPEIPVSAFRVNGGLNFAGANAREFWDSTGLLWLPRIGLAYQATRSTVVRSGYGIFYGSLGAFRTTANLAGFSQTTPIQPTQDNGQTFTATLANPFPNGLIAPLGATGGLETNLGQNITYFPRDRKAPYAQRWSFGVQQEMKGGFVVRPPMSATAIPALPANRNINGTPAQYLSTSPTRDQAAHQFSGRSVSESLLRNQPPVHRHDFQGESAASVSAVRRHYVCRSGWVFVVSLASIAHREAFRARLHTSGVAHMVQGHGRDAVSESDGSDALRVAC